MLQMFHIANKLISMFNSIQFYLCIGFNNGYCLSAGFCVILYQEKNVVEHDDI